MKLSDLTLGMWVAVPHDQPGKAMAKEGRNALPAQVVGVGKYRISRLSRCNPIITDDGYRTTVHLRVLDPQTTWPDFEVRRERLNSRYWGHGGLLPADFPGLPEGPKLTSKKLHWVEDVMDASRIAMPWSQFITEVSEHRLFELETEGYQQRRSEIINLLAAEAMKVGRFIIRRAEHYEGRGIGVMVDVNVEEILRDFPGLKLGPVVEELRDIERRLACAR